MKRSHAIGLESCRLQISEIDKEIASLLARRFDVCGRVGRLKAELHMPIHVPGRALEVIQLVGDGVERRRYQVEVRKVYLTILRQSELLQSKLRERDDSEELVHEESL